MFFAYTPIVWKEIELKTKQLKVTDETARNFIRFFISPASECVLDKLGRIMLPANLREYAVINKEVVISGAGDKVEIWSKANWDLYWKGFKNSEKDFINQMKDIGL